MEALQEFGQFIRTHKFCRHLRRHLKNVYGSIAWSLMAFTAGVYYAHYKRIKEGDIPSALAVVIWLIVLAQRKEDRKRFLYLNGLALCGGLSIGPLIDEVWDINPSIVISAFLTTSVIFVCSTLSALLAPDGKYLALGGPLLSILVGMLCVEFVNVFLKSPTLLYTQLFLLGIPGMCGYILFETQRIVKGFRMSGGHRDFVWDSVVLFMTLVSIFERILVLWGSQAKSSQENDLI